MNGLVFQSPELGLAATRRRPPMKDPRPRKPPARDPKPKEPPRRDPPTRRREPGQRDPGVIGDPPPKKRIRASPLVTGAAVISEPRI